MGKVFVALSPPIKKEVWATKEKSWPILSSWTCFRICWKDARDKGKRFRNKFGMTEEGEQNVILNLFQDLLKGREVKRKDSELNSEWHGLRRSEWTDHKSLNGLSSGPKKMSSWTRFRICWKDASKRKKDSELNSEWQRNKYKKIFMWMGRHDTKLA